ncbi:hypothetical protein BJX68DRAFT_247299 [Aspergillus pseudodeflectus]|uniref:Uncharacterized protein n=1 Tax=Aspergillus pseudodeflectus TaxID=176178 RepID=A0ABR4JIJ3_9EURO
MPSVETGLYPSVSGASGTISTTNQGPPVEHPPRRSRPRKAKEKGLCPAPVYQMETSKVRFPTHP